MMRVKGVRRMQVRAEVVVVKDTCQVEVGWGGELLSQRSQAVAVQEKEAWRGKGEEAGEVREREWLEQVGVGVEAKEQGVVSHWSSLA
jgi:hypothetical protein